MMLDGTYHVDCECGAAHHTIRFVRNISDKEAYLDVFLDKPWEWKRKLDNVWKYLRNVEREYGDFGTTLFDHGSALGLELFLERIASVNEQPAGPCLFDGHDNVARVRVDDEDEDIGPELVLSVSMKPGPWYKRLYRALRYLTGYYSRYGQWDCFDINKNDAALLRERIQYYRLRRGDWLEDQEAIRNKGHG